jgi:hypothetical protein
LNPFFLPYKRDPISLNFIKKKFKALFQDGKFIASAQPVISTSAEGITTVKDHNFFPLLPIEVIHVDVAHEGKELTPCRTPLTPSPPPLCALRYPFNVPPALGLLDAWPAALPII